MKAIHYLAFALISLASVSSCKKAGNSAPSDPTPTKKQKYLTAMTQGVGANVTTTTYTYDDKKRIKIIKAGTTTTEYIYSLNDIAWIESTNTFGTSISKTITTYTYEDGHVATLSTVGKVDNVEKSWYNAGLLFVNGRVTEEHGDNAIVVIYVYNNNNDVVETQFWDHKIVKTYSDKKNALDVNPQKKPSDVLVPHLILSSTTDPIDHPTSSGLTTYNYVFDAKGNVTERTQQNTKIASLNSKTTFTYDDDNYLSGAVTTNTAGTVTNKVTYTWTEL